MENRTNEINANNLFDLYDAIVFDCENNDIEFTAQHIEAYADAFNILLEKEEIELMLKVYKDWEECENKCSNEYYYLVKAPLLGEE